MRASRFVFFRSALVLVVVAALAGPTSAKADFQLVTASTLSDLQTALQANDSAGWSGFNISTPTVVTANGINVQAVGGGSNGFTFGPTTLSGYPALVDAGGPVYSEGGLGTFTDSVITLNFSQPVTAVGGLMEAFAYITGFEGCDGFTLTAEDSKGNSQGFTLAANSSPFVGIVSNTDNISRLVIDTGYLNWPTQMEVGPLALQDSPAVSSVPAPSGFTLASLSALCLLGCRCWRRCRPAIA